MIGRAICVVALLLPVPSAVADDPKPPQISGYVTTVASPTAFDVNGTHIDCDSGTQFETMDAKGTRSILKTPEYPYIGQALDVYGKADKKKHTIHATVVVAYLPKDVKLSGTAIIDHVPDDSMQTKGERLFSADGYRILVTAKTQMTFTPPLTSVADVGTNVWMKYSGTQRADGVLVADMAVFTKNVVANSEDKLRKRTEYDPRNVNPDSKQSSVSKYFFGINPKEIPPYNDLAMQARVDRIGLSVIPAYQRGLAKDDPTRIDFRFQLIDQRKWHDAMTLPNGIILVPRQVVERLENDSQLATVLADNVACALEKQTYRQIPDRNGMTAAELGGAAAGIFVPGLGLATDLANRKAASVILRHAQEQSGRVSLVLLHDAGYDMREAPIAWWLLAPKKPTPMIDTPLPERAAYLYETIGTTWRSRASSGKATHP